MLKPCSCWIASLHVDCELIVTSCMSSEMQTTCFPIFDRTRPLPSHWPRTASASSGSSAGRRCRRHSVVICFVRFFFVLFSMYFLGVGNHILVFLISFSFSIFRSSGSSAGPLCRRPSALYERQESLQHIISFLVVLYVCFFYKHYLYFFLLFCFTFILEVKQTTLCKLSCALLRSPALSCAPLRSPALPALNGLHGFRTLSGPRVSSPLVEDRWRRRNLQSVSHTWQATVTAISQDMLRQVHPTSKYIELRAKPKEIQHLSQEMYACKTTKPQGQEEQIGLESLELAVGINSEILKQAE